MNMMQNITICAFASADAAESAWTNDEAVNHAGAWTFAKWAFIPFTEDRKSFLEALQEAKIRTRKGDIEYRKLLRKGGAK